MDKLANTRLEPPEQLTLKAERLVWEYVVGSYDAGYFNHGDFPLLINFCRFSVKADKAFKQLSREQDVIDDGPNPLIKIYKEYCTQLTAFSTKLRIAPNARTRSETVQHSSKQAKSNRVFDPTQDWRSHQTLDG